MGWNLTQAHRDTITIPLRVQHMLLRPQTEIPYHLHSFRILHHYMTFLDHTLHEMLMDQLPERPPQSPILHNQQMAAAGDCMSNIRPWSIAVFRAFSVNELLDDAAIGNYDGSSGS